MRPHRVRFMIRWLMAVVAITACSTAAAIAFSIEPNTAVNVLAAWTAIYGIPAILIVARGVPLGKANKIVRRSVLQRGCVPHSSPSCAEMRYDEKTWKA